ncbi:MAG: hypothetical protein RBQ97_06825 [Acholeplasma sp.]|nr:hypothetical protein [Acholeplasma sp.]
MSFKDDLNSNIENDLSDMFGLSENKNSLEFDLQHVIENGIDKYNQMLQDEQKRKDEIKEIVIELLSNKDFINKLMNVLEFEGFVKDCPTCYWNIKKYGKLK